MCSDTSFKNAVLFYQNIDYVAVIFAIETGLNRFPQDVRDILNSCD